MAGEIQLNSTTMATESSGSITAQLDTIRPNTTNGSLTLQGDSSDAGVTGLTIDSSGVVNTTTAKVTNIQATSGQSLTIKDEDGNAAITVGTDNTAASYLSLNFGSYHGGSGTLSGNTLSDYEEGTFVPTVSTGTATYLYAHYTKIGRLVNCGGVISSFSDRSSANNIEFALPFNSRSGARFKGTVLVRYLDRTANTTVIEIADSSSTGKLVVGDSANYVTLQHSDLNNTSSQIQFEICYETT